MILEACVGTVEDAVAAQTNGADQLELCDRLDLDGTSPPRELVVAVCQAVSIPVKVILNPVSFDYSYSADQLDDILAYMASLEDLKLAGFVFGTLDQHKMPDLGAVEKIATATDLPITFHKAIDDTADILAALDHIAQSNLVQFVLSSGGSPTAQQGQGRLIEMRDQNRGIADADGVCSTAFRWNTGFSRKVATVLPAGNQKIIQFGNILRFIPRKDCGTHK